MPRKKKAPSSSGLSSPPVVKNPYGFGITGISDPTGFAADIPSEGTLGISKEDMSKYSHILEDPTLSTAQKKRALLREQGIVGTRKKLSSKEKKARVEARKVKKSEALSKAGFASRGPKRTYEEQRSTSKARGVKKRDWGRLVARSVPQTAAYYGLDPGRARKTTDIDIESMQELMYQELRKKFEK